jgi:hypothetical protein
MMTRVILDFALSINQQTSNFQSYSVDKQVLYTRFDRYRYLHTGILRFAEFNLKNSCFLPIFTNRIRVHPYYKRYQYVDRYSGTLQFTYGTD